LVSVLIAANLVSIEGAGSCPSAEQIQQRVEALRPDGASPALVVRLVKVDGAAAIEIGSAPPVRRRLPAEASCDDQAAVAATIIAAWQGQLDAAVPPPTPAPAPPAPTRPAPASSPATVARRRAVSGEIDAAWLAAIGPGGNASGAELAARLSIAGWRFGFFVGAIAESTRTLGLASGGVDWGRAALSVGADYRLGRGRWSLDLRAQALAALVYLAGGGFAQNYQRFDGDFGLGAGARVGVRLARVRPFLGADAVGWLRSEQALAQEGNVTAAAELPRFEVLLSLGVALVPP